MGVREFVAWAVSKPISAAVRQEVETAVDGVEAWKKNRERMIDQQRNHIAVHGGDERPHWHDIPREQCHRCHNYDELEAVRDYE